MTESPLHLTGESPPQLELRLPTWPERPPVRRSEQRRLALEGSAEERYAAWRATPDSNLVMAMLRTIAMEWIQRQPKIGPRSLWEACPIRLKKSVDNRLQALACRELEDTVPALRGCMRHRERAKGEAA